VFLRRLNFLTSLLAEDSKYSHAKLHREGKPEGRSVDKLDRFESMQEEDFQVGVSHNFEMLSHNQTGSFKEK